MVSQSLAVFALGALFASGPLLAAQEPATIRGRLLDPSGEPLAGVRVSVAEEQIEPGGRDGDEIHEPWVGPAVDSGDDGTFALVFAPPGDSTLTLCANRDDLAPASWKLRKVTAGRVIEVEDAVLHPCGDLIGRLVGEDDRPLPGSWTVGVFPAAVRSGGLDAVV